MDVFADKKIILYGFGYCGMIAAELFHNDKKEIALFFDKDRQKTGMEYEEIKVEYPHEIENSDEYIVVICILKKGRLYNDIKNYLSELKFTHIVHIYDLREAPKLFEKQNLVLCPDREKVEVSLEHYKRLHDALGDLESKETLDTILEFMIKDVDVEFYHHPIDKQYFAYDIYRNIPHEVIIDCGAFKGDEIRNYEKYSKYPFDKYIAIEADGAYKEYIEREKALSRNSEVDILCPMAVSDACSILKIKNYGNTNSVIREDGERSVQAETLDELCKGISVTFIKIDVEGYERKAIRGARNLIAKNLPVIAVAAYHREEDFYVLYDMIRDISDQYRFYLRSYMNMQETVLYAVPPKRLVTDRVE